MENIDKIQSFLKGLDHSIDDLEPVLEKLLSKSYVDRISEMSTPMEKIKFTNGYTYILVSLLFAYLKSKGTDTTKHEVMNELNRCKSYMARAKSLEAQNASGDQKGNLLVRGGNNLAPGSSSVVIGKQEPAISRVSFEGKHTRFADNNDTDDKSDVISAVKDSRSKDTKKANQVHKPKPSKSGKLAKISKPEINKKNSGKKT